MEPTGDPEARIRDLERGVTTPLPYGAEQYGSHSDAQAGIPPQPYPQPYGAELSGSPYGAQPYGSPYGAEPYGSPYYAPPQQVVHKRSQSAVWLIPLVVGVVVVAGIVGAIFFFVVDNASTRGTGVSGGGGPIAAPTIPTVPVFPSLPEIPSVPALPPMPGAGPADGVLTVTAGGSLSISGVDRRQTVVCDQGTVSISGMNNTVEVQGACAAVTVSGMNNTITVQSAGTISASGFDNRVTYRDGDPQTSQAGNGNVITRG
jgi:hypothetical protein